MKPQQTTISEVKPVEGQRSKPHREYRLNARKMHLTYLWSTGTRIQKNILKSLS
jgi:hypothetical protein